ncbi:MAG: hypothetical protein QOJ63_452 [Solirubrobacteraceae bacterium]|nr:hypothetical protein [Solirubrobacteraceae bacterium]
MSAARPRIAFVTPLHFGDEGYVGGGERYPLNLAKALVATNPNAHVDLIGAGDVARVQGVQPRLDIHVLPITLRADSFLDNVSSAIIDALEPADVVHVHQAFTRPSQVGILTAKLLGKPVVLTDHGAGSTRVNDAVHYLDLVDLMIFQSRFAAAQIATTRGRVVIPGGVDARFFRPPEGPRTRSHVLFVGRLLAHKGIDRLLAALPRDLPCVVAGRAYDDTFARYIRALARTRDVRIVEDADDLALRELYRGAWATVLPSVHHDAWGRVYKAPELMGLTALESMACGTPAVVSTAGALPEFVRDGETGFVFGSLGELQRRLRALAAGVHDADLMGARAREEIERHYALEPVGERLWAAYESVLQGAAACAS